jgi:hypothetical protein
LNRHAEKLSLVIHPVITENLVHDRLGQCRILYICVSFTHIAVAIQKNSLPLLAWHLALARH